MSLEAQRVPLVVLVGAFNSQILRDPQWVKKYLFPDSAQQEIPLNYNVAMVTGELSSSMVIDGSDFRVEPERIRITPPSPAEPAIAEDVAVRLAGELPHTPLSAFGVNFQYKETRGKSVLRGNAFLSRMTGMCEADGQLRLESRVKHEESFLTFSITEDGAADGATLLYDFNFHVPMGNAQYPAMKKLSEKILEGVVGRFAAHAEKMARAVSDELSSMEDA